MSRLDPNGFYALLGLSPSCSSVEIKKSFRRLALEWHPDKNPSEEAKSHFQKISVAYSILSDEEKRTKYDQGLLNEHGEEDGGMGDFDFADLFGRGGFSGGMDPFQFFFQQAFFGGDFHGGFVDEVDEEMIFEVVFENFVSKSSKAWKCKVCQATKKNKNSMRVHFEDKHEDVLEMIADDLLDEAGEDDEDFVSDEEEEGFHSFSFGHPMHGFADSDDEDEESFDDFQAFAQTFFQTAGGLSRAPTTAGPRRATGGRKRAKAKVSRK